MHVEPRHFARDLLVHFSGFGLRVVAAALIGREGLLVVLNGAMYALVYADLLSAAIAPNKTLCLIEHRPTRLAVRAHRNVLAGFAELWRHRRQRGNGVDRWPLSGCDKRWFRGESHFCTFLFLFWKG